MEKDIKKTSSRKIDPWAIRIWALVLTAIGIESLLVLFGISIGINPTASQPYRIFIILKGPPPGRDGLVVFSFPGTRYYREGVLFVKEVKGLPGDRLEIRGDRTVRLNGEFIDTVRATDSQGRGVDPFLYDGVIPTGSYFLYSPARNSYDSRYYGLIKRERIVGKAIPLY
jgi:conjugal transfer pilin signal peptidase TrbI